MEVGDNVLDYYINKKSSKRSKNENVASIQKYDDIQNLLQPSNETIQMTDVVVVLPMMCQWGDCNMCFVKIVDYRIHAKIHLHELQEKNVNNEDNSCKFLYIIVLILL